MAQYESENRVPKNNLVQAMAELFDVKPDVLKVPDIDSFTGLIHTLFAIEDCNGLKIEKAEDGHPQLYLDLRNHPGSMQFYDMLMDWMDKSEALRSGQITPDEYDAWRYHYPTPGQTTHSHFATVPPQE